MSSDYDEQVIKDALSAISTPEYDIATEVKKNMKTQKTPRAFKRAINVLVAASMCVILSVGVMAGIVPGVNKLVDVIRPEIALMLQPIGLSSEDQGIKMEVLAAMNDNDMATIYLTMQDLTGDRIDKTLDLYNYSLSGVSMQTCEIINYDEQSKIATLRLQANGGKNLNGKKASFGITSFLSHKVQYDAVETGINLTDITKEAQTISFDMSQSSGGGGNLYSKFEEQGRIKVLKTDEMNRQITNIDFMHISNIGFIDGLLHIQTKWNSNNVDDHGYFYFKDSLGNKIDVPESNIYFGMDKRGITKYGRDYIEYIFDLNKMNLNELKLMGYWVANGNYTTGAWQTTFKIQSVGIEKKENCNVKFDTIQIDQVSISQMGITLSGKNTDSDTKEMTIKDHMTISANMTDGSVKIFDPVISNNDNGKIRLKCIAPLPLDVSNVKSVTIGTNVINFH